MGIVLKQQSKMKIVNVAAVLIFVIELTYGVPQPSVGDGPIVRDQKMELLPGDRFDHEFNQLRVNLEDESNRQNDRSGCKSGCYPLNGKCWMGSLPKNFEEYPECGRPYGCTDCRRGCQKDSDCPDGGANYWCNKAGHCKCQKPLIEKNWECVERKCPGDCSGNGWCNTDETCHCDFGYEGVDCSVVSACEDKDAYYCEMKKDYCDHVPHVQTMCPKSCKKCINENIPKCQQASYDGGFYQPIVISGSCYRLSMTATKTWSEAKTICQSNGGKLFEPRESVKSQAVVDEIRNIYNDNGIWIGLTDAASEGNWQYASDGTFASYTNWHLNEPNNAGEGENCAIIHSGHRDWFDYPCEAQNYFLCQF